MARRKRPTARKRIGGHKSAFTKKKTENKELQRTITEQARVIANRDKQIECLLGQLRRARVTIRFPRPLWRGRNDAALRRS